MPRRVGSGFFLGDTAFLSDSKFRALQRRLPEPDDFNAAVGAYWIVLASARRNGSPEIDARAETDSRFIDDLEAVGLLTPTGFDPGPFGNWRPQAPQQVEAGRARAASATRTTLGTYSSVASAVEPLDQRVQPSLPIPSYQLPSVEGESPREGDPLETYWTLSGNYPSGNAKRWLEEMAEEFGASETSEAVAGEWSHGSRNDVLKRTQNRLRANRDKTERTAPRPIRALNPLQEQLRAAYLETYGPEETFSPHIVKDVPA